MIQPNEVDNKSALKVLIQLTLGAPDEETAQQLAYVAMNLSSQMTDEEIRIVRKELVETIRCEMSEDMEKMKVSYEEVHELIYLLPLPTKEN